MRTEDVVREFIIDELEWSGRVDDLADDLPLITSKAIDSLGIVQMVLFLESRFEFKVRDEEVILCNFESIQAIAEFVEKKRLS
jgi:acyl carrier protein